MKRKSLIVLFFVVLYDQIIKYVINSSFYYGKMFSIIPNLFYITRVNNDGAAWSTFSGGRFFLIAIAIIAFFFLLWLQKGFKDTKRNLIAFGLVYGGLIGNLIDRVIYGYVIDYIDIKIFGYDFPVFNLADIAIVIGFLLLMLSIIKGEDKNANNS